MTLARVRNSISRSRAARALLHPAILVRRALLRRQDTLRNRLVKNLQQCLAEDPVIRVEEFRGTFLVDRRSHLFARVASEGSYEPELAAACTAHLDPDRDAIDVGANVGFYTTLIAQQLRRRRVLAIEPTDNALAKLRHNVERNGIGARTIVHAGLAADREGTQTLNIVEGKEEYSSLGELVHPSVANERVLARQVPATTIDALVALHGLDPGFIKIDVEGAELDVLRGAQGTLRRCRPVVLSELSSALLAQRRVAAADVVAYLTGLGYRVVDPLHPGEPFVPREYGDMLCLPLERGAPTPSS